MDRLVVDFTSSHGGDFMVNEVTGGSACDGDGENTGGPSKEYIRWNGFAQKPYPYWETGANREMVEAEKDIYDYIIFRRWNTKGDPRFNRASVSQEEIAEGTGITKAVVSRTLANLVACGTIRVTRQSRRSYGDEPGICKEYELCQPFAFDKTKRVHDPARKTSRGGKWRGKKKAKGIVAPETSPITLPDAHYLAR